MYMYVWASSYAFFLFWGREKCDRVYMLCTKITLYDSSRIIRYAGMILFSSRKIAGIFEFVYIFGV